MLCLKLILARAEALRFTAWSDQIDLTGIDFLTIHNRVNQTARSWKSKRTPPMPPSSGNRGLIGGFLGGQWWLMTSKSCENPLLNNLCARLRTWLTLQDGNQFIHAVLVAQNLEQNRVRNMGYVCDMYVICGFLFLGLEFHGMMSLDLQHLGFLFR